MDNFTSSTSRPKAHLFLFLFDWESETAALIDFVLVHLLTYLIATAAAAAWTAAPRNSSNRQSAVTRWQSSQLAGVIVRGKALAVFTSAVLSVQWWRRMSRCPRPLVWSCSLQVLGSGWSRRSIALDDPVTHDVGLVDESSRPLRNC